MKYGFEREWFVRKGNVFTTVPSGVAADECGYLAEARGKESSDVIEAAYLLLAQEQKLMRELQAAGLILDWSIATVKLPKDFMRDVNRRFGKNPYPAERGNIYGKDFSVHDSWQRAGLHVHFSDAQAEEVGVIDCAKCHRRERIMKDIPRQLNMPKLIRALDVKFAVEIKQAKRVPGFYEMKPWGFEYRSLPNTVDVVLVAEFLKSLG